MVRRAGLDVLINALIAAFAGAVIHASIRAMRKRVFDADYAVAVNALASAMGRIIRRSIMMVICGSIANVIQNRLALLGLFPEPAAADA